jgi:hypothetical protein
MRHQTLFLALAATVSLGLPALAADAGKACSTHECAADKACDTPGKCGANHENCGPACLKVSQRPVAEGDACDPSGPRASAARHPKGSQSDKDCCEEKKDCCEEQEACCDEQGKPMGGKEDCCAHDRKADCKDKECREHAGKRDTCGEDCEETCEHHDGRRQMMHHRMARFGARTATIRQLWSQPMPGETARRNYTMIEMDRLFGPTTRSAWWSPKVGMGCTYGLDLTEQTNTRHLGYGGLIGQNTFRFGRFRLTAGVLVGGGLNLDITPNLSFQNYNGFVVADPRLSLGWQVSPKLAVNLTGNYLFTSRMDKVGGPGAGLSLNVGF